MDFEVRPPADDREIEELARVLHRSFAAAQPRAVADGWLAPCGRESLRVVLRDGAVAGGCAVVPMAQHFGGRPVPTAGIHAVGIDPAHRGRGAARALMRAVLAEARGRGTPLSTLFASSVPLYRSVGYERAGASFRAEVPLASLAPLRGARTDLAVRALDDADRDAVAAIYARTAPRQAGHLERNDFAWGRLARAAGDAVLHEWVVARGGEVRGAARWHQTLAATRGAPGGAYYDLELVDLVAADAEAVRSILTLFADHASLGGTARWASGPDDPFLLALPDRAFALSLTDVWMVRVLDLAAAARARGWPAGVAGELHLEVADADLPAHAGRWVLRVADGAAEVERGGAGRLRLDVRGLAPLLTGYLTPHALSAAGWIEAPVEDLDRAAALFAGPLPWLRDRW
jgi:predicted acetyltransferase